MAARVLSRMASRRIANCLLSASSSRQLPVGNGFQSFEQPAFASTLIRCSTSHMHQSLRHPSLLSAISQRFVFTSSSSPEPEKEANQSDVSNTESDNKSGDATSSEKSHEADVNLESKGSNSQSDKRKTTKRTEFSDSEEEKDLSFDDLVNLVAEKEELLKLKQKEIEKMQDKVLRSYAEMENVIDRTKREAENSKKFAIQSFAKGLLDVADNLERASSVGKDSFSKIDESKDSIGAVPLIKTLLEGVEMTNKQLAEVFRKYGVEKFNPLNEQFDPHRHLAVFQLPDSSKQPGTVAVVVKSGYMLHDRVIRPAEVGVTQAAEKTD
ncbi:grpE protein homolog 2, mitochondrial-like [Zingiber officinale]|uniref:grpE protein homolog 2, mitochondrial-like n=1 Tax=Zingiber officinale TaxID=94328 RepID=UPI001C4AA9F3|nr:grpE protein homolog 2, mitochondrial-like [Zingiber officinale]